MDNPSPPTPRLSATILAFGIVYVVWGSTYLAIRVVVLGMPPLLSAGARFLVAGAAFGVWALVSRAERPSLRELGWAALTGTMLAAIGNGGVSLAETRIDSGIAALIVGLVPIWMSVFGAFVGHPITWRVWIGLGLGLGGVFILAAPGRNSATDVLGVGILLVATLSWAFASVLSKHVAMPKSVVTTSSVQMLAGGSVLLVASAARRETRGWDPTSLSPSVILSLAYLVVFGSLIAFTAYAWMLRHHSPSAVASYAYVNPVVAVILGALVLHERLSPRIGFAGLLIVAAAALLTLKPKRMGPPAAAPPSIAATNETP